MSIDGAQNAHPNVDQATNFAFDSIKEGIKNNNLTDVVAGVDQELSGSQLNAQEKRAVSHALGGKLQESGLLPRVLVDYSSKSFDSLSNGDKYIQALDLDSVLQAGIESNSPVKGLIARQLRTNMSSIALSHEDANSFRDESPSQSEEIGKGISQKDLSEWGTSRRDGNFHTDMSARMVSLFGNTDRWHELSGKDNLLSKDELDQAKIDTVKFSSQERNTLNYMRDNFGGIRAASSGDSAFKMSLSDVVDWSQKHGVSADIAEAPVKHVVEGSIDANDKVGSNTDLGLRAIKAGLQDGTLTANIRQVDNHLVNSGLTDHEIQAIQTGVRQGLSSDQLFKRTMGQYAIDNFDQLKGDNRYIQKSDLDPLLQSADAKNRPIETMLIANLRHNSDTIAMAADDVRNDDSDSAEKRRGISIDDLLNMRNEDVDVRQHVDMSKNMLKFFGSTENFNVIANGDNQLSKDDLDSAKMDTFRFDPAQRSTLNYMRENYGSIKSAASGDGSKISISDLLNHASKYGVTNETIRMEESTAQARQSGRSLEGAVEHRAEPVNQGEPVGRVNQDTANMGRRVETQDNHEHKEPVRRETSDNRSRQVGHVGDASEATTVKLGPNDRIWNLAIQKYGKPEIEAIFEANGMQPKVVAENGQPVLLDPAYESGKEIIMPAASEIPALTRQYRERANQLREQYAERSGDACEETSVKLMYGDTLSNLAMQKYGRKVPIEALYEANNLPPRFEKNDQGQTIAREPIYFAGRKYVLPPLQDIDRLAQTYVQKHFRR